jgi:hypothetical protein
VAEHSDMLETVICWINCILEICLVLLFQALNMLKFGIKRQNLFYGPIKMIILEKTALKLDENFFFLQILEIDFFSASFGQFYL